jgi:hypothetical protein
MNKRRLRRQKVLLDARNDFLKSYKAKFQKIIPSIHSCLFGSEAAVL